MTQIWKKTPSRLRRSPRGRQIYPMFYWFISLLLGTETNLCSVIYSMTHQSVFYPSLRMVKISIPTDHNTEYLNALLLGEYSLSITPQFKRNTLW